MLSVQRITWSTLNVSSTSLYEQYYGIAPHLLPFKIFGVRGYPTVLSKGKRNHDPKVIVGLFEGYQGQLLQG